MPLRVTLELIGGDVVTRFNGNNPQGARERRREESPRPPSKKQAQITAWRKRKASEIRYDRRTEWLAKGQPVG